MEEEFTPAHELVGEESPILLDPVQENEGCQAIVQALTEDEKLHLADEHMPLRHLRAEKGNVQEAIRKIKDTIQWRQDFQVEKIKTCFEPHGDPTIRAILEKENETGKIYCRGYDKDGRVCMYMRPHYENTKNAQHQMMHLVYNLERAIACTVHKSGREKINLVIDYFGFRLRDSPPLSTSKYTLDILQKHYPERMYIAYLCNPPMVFTAFWTVIQPFVDPTTKAKICFVSSSSSSSSKRGKNNNESNDKVKEHFDLTTIEKCAGGMTDLRPFDSTEYFAKPFHKAFDE